MNFRMGKILGFWVDAEYESRRCQVHQSKTELFRQILLEWEEDGDAMRYVDRSRPAVSKLATEKYCRS
jgi:hypothetical protein